MNHMCLDSITGGQSPKHNPSFTLTPPEHLTSLPCLPKHTLMSFPSPLIYSILNMKASWRADDSSSSRSSVVSRVSYWTFGESLVHVCQGWQPCVVISPVILSRFSAGLEAVAGRWWGSCENVRLRERERKSRVFSLLPNSLSALTLTVTVRSELSWWMRVFANFYQSYHAVTHRTSLSREKQNQRDRQRGFEASVRHIVVAF